MIAAASAASSAPDPVSCPSSCFLRLPSVYGSSPANLLPYGLGLG